MQITKAKFYSEIYSGVLYGVIMGVLIGFIVSAHTSPSSEPPLPRYAKQNGGGFMNEIPTVQEIQKLVGCTKIDGIIGEETKRLWDLALCQQEADKWNWYYGDKK